MAVIGLTGSASETGLSRLARELLHRRGSNFERAILRGRVDDRWWEDTCLQWTIRE